MSKIVGIGATLTIGLIDGDELQTLVQRILAPPAANVAKAQEAMTYRD